MDSFVNECITGKYDHSGDAIIYGDSVTKDTLIKTSDGEITIEELFSQSSDKSIIGDREYATGYSTKVLGFNGFEDSVVASSISYVMRHKTKKKIYLIELENGKSVKVTEDHSIIVDRDGFLLDIKPTEILDTDLTIVLALSSNDTERTKVKSVTCLGEIDDYVYDISIDDQDPYFFANDILVHNTDSVYFSAWPIIRADVEAGKLSWDKDICIKVYDNIADQLNESFPGFMERAFHCTRDMGAIIKGGRELVASTGIYITKKRYAVLCYDKEGERLDKDGKPGKIKAMGLDLKRSDTPKFVQEFLSKLLLEVLTGAEREQVYTMVKEFKIQFQKLPSWEKGTPKRVNNLTKFTAAEEKQGRANVPGHVRAALNWNRLKRMNGDNYSMNIVDGMKTVVCKLKPNPLGYTSVGYPTDEKHIPQWFKDLPFDDDTMELTIVDQKVDNLLGVLNWNIAENTDTKTNINSLFSFE